MDLIAIIIGCAWILIGVLIIALSIPLALGRVRPNQAYGVRVRGSFQSDDAWYAINRYGGKCLIAWAVPLVILGLAILFLPLRRHPLLSLPLGFAPLVFVLAPTFAIFRFARRYRPGV